MFRKYFTILSFFIIGVYILISFVFTTTNNIRFANTHSDKKTHQYGYLPDKNLSYLVSLISINDFRNILKPILIERVVGTTSHDLVKNYIIAEMRQLNWKLEIDPFHDSTPKGKLLFTNIIATYKPNADRFLVFACHYDSKLSNFRFIGATDSAVPCAMLIYLAKILNDELHNMNSEIGLKFIFFDGEEAFVSWTDNDSLYGSRHLSSVMESRSRTLDDYPNEISEFDKIDLFVLLDLLGAPYPQFFSYYRNTDRWYRVLVMIEQRLRSKSLLKADDEFIYQPYFTNYSFYDAKIADDHEPFLKKGVPVLHIIPTPFPQVWHTEYDDERVINYQTISNLLKIFEIFIVKYLTGGSPMM